MHHEGDESVLRQLRSASSSVWLTICPGTMRGVYGGGQVTALERRKLTNAFAGVIGVSTGAPTGAYFLAGQAELGTSIYYEECTSPEFISFARMMRGGNGGDVAYLAKEFRSGAKKLDQQRIYASDTELWFGITEYDSATEHFIDAKLVKPDIVHGIQVSAAMPVLYRDELFVDGVRYNDGGVSCRPIRYALSKKPTGIVVFANCPEDRTDSTFKDIATHVLMGREPLSQQYAMRQRHVVFEEDLDMLRGSGVPYLVIHTDGEIGSYCRDSRLLHAAADRACRHLLELLDRAGFS